MQARRHKQRPTAKTCGKRTSRARRSHGGEAHLEAAEWRLLPTWGLGLVCTITCTAITPKQHNMHMLKARSNSNSHLFCLSLQVATSTHDRSSS